jgi:hypothetical protein
MKESHTATYLPIVEHVPQSDELAIEGLKRHRQHLAAQKERDASEQKRALELANQIAHDLD